MKHLRYHAWALACMVVVVCALTRSAHADEARCTELGANCFCSAPLNGPGPLIQSAVNYVWRTGETLTKKCTIEDQDGPITRNLSDIGSIYQANDANILARFPSGHSVSYFHRANNGHNSLWSVGHKFTSSQKSNYSHLAMRAYVYMSDASNGDPASFQFTANGCGGNSGKIMAFSVDLGPYFSVQNINNGWTFANWGGSSVWTGQNANCCVAPPGYDATGRTTMTPAYMLGKWVRWESHVINEENPPVILRTYMTDPATGTTYKMLDTSIPTTMSDGQDWSSTNATTLTETGTHGRMGHEFFRTGSCPGFFAISHVMYAGWTTDAGQMIGAASEVEGGGGGGGGTPNKAPFNLRLADAGDLQ